MLLRKEWRLNPAVPAAGSLIGRILAGRGIAAPEAAQQFLHPTFEQLHDPFLLPDMAAACRLIGEAIDAGQRIMIHGDYDVDGITATALLLRFLRKIGADCRWLIPDRMADGYGLTAASVDQIKASGASVLITVDCGTASLEETRLLRQSGITTVITDHHECLMQMPEAAAFVNPKRPDSRYPFAGLAGVGVTLKLIQGICQLSGLGKVWQDDMELVALGTVADVVPLLDENRVLVKAGLESFAQRHQVGLSALLDTIGLDNRPITSQTLGFALAPRLNAAGRLGSANIALALLLSEDPAEAARIAGDLVELNRRRQELETAITAEASQIIEAEFDFSAREIPIVAKPGWHPGVIGIVAARLADQYCRPVIVLCGENGLLRGSGRSYGDFDLLAAIGRAADCTVQYGGHRKAAGVVLSSEKLADFKQLVNEYARQNMPAEPLRPLIQADAEIDPAALTLAQAEELAQLAPFGEDNPQPLLIIRRLTVQSVRQAGNGRHLKIRLAADVGTTLDGIAFGQADADEVFGAGDRVDVLFALEVNQWQGRRSLSLVIRDMVHSLADSEFADEPWIADRIYRETADLDQLMRRYDVSRQDLVPARDEYKTVYQFIRARFGDKPVLIDLSLLARWIGRSYAIDLNMFRLARILHVFEEMQLISLQQMGDDRVRLKLQPVEGKVRLETSSAYRHLEAEGVGG